MAHWGFRCYIDARGQDVIRAWHDNELSEDGQGAFLARLMTLAATPRTEWGRPEYAPLRKDGKGLGEIRFKADKVQHRPLGFHLPDEKVFVIVFPAIEKGDAFKPKDAVKIALGRKQEVLSDRRRARGIWLELE